MNSSSGAEVQTSAARVAGSSIAENVHAKRPEAELADSHSTSSGCGPSASPPPFQAVLHTRRSCLPIRRGLPAIVIIVTTAVSVAVLVVGMPTSIAIVPAGRRRIPWRGRYIVAVTVISVAVIHGIAIAILVIATAVIAIAVSIAAAVMVPIDLLQLSGLTGIECCVSQWRRLAGIGPLFLCHRACTEYSRSQRHK